MNAIQKNSKGNHPLDYPLNTTDKLYVDIKNKLSSLRSSCLTKFRWYRDTYSVILRLSSLGLEINLGKASLFLGENKVRLRYIGNISKSDKILLPDKFELNNNLKIGDQFKKRPSKEKINFFICISQQTSIINLDFK